ncbi:MAG: hypothetical protein LBN21_08720 [Treponema sp.]|nr:hypothetical protein [Treponema sp.]
MANPMEGGGTEYIPLDSGAPVYVFADVENSRLVLENVLRQWIKGNQRDQILDRTGWAIAAIYPEKRYIQAVAWGKYPAIQAGFAFTFDKNWKKKKSPSKHSYWYSERDGLSVSLNASQAYIAAAMQHNADSSTDPFYTPPGTELPEGFFEFTRGAILTILLNEPAVPVNRLLKSMDMPIDIPAEKIFVSLFPLPAGVEAAEDNNLYEVLFRIQTPTASQARALVTIISFAKPYIMIAAPGGKVDFRTLAALLFANTPVQDGKNLTLRITSISEKEIALLLSLFSVY